MHSYAIKFDGSLCNLRGHHGNDDPDILLTDTVSVSAGMLHSLAVKSDGTLWAWGENRFGQLGDGTRTVRKLPVFVMNDVVFACAGTYHSIAIKSDHTLWTWGLIPDVIIDAGSAQSEVPQTKPVMFMSDVKSAAAGELHSLAVKTDGTLWAWGKNFYGQLGDGTDVNKKFPEMIMTDVEEVSAGVRYSLCRKTDGSIYAWGLNESYELGDGTDINRNTPMLIKLS
jgi:alpha-tubulin suppressor-like RCC1 family protein